MCRFLTLQISINEALQLFQVPPQAVSICAELNLHHTCMSGAAKDLLMPKLT